MSDIVEELRSRTTGIVLLSDPPQFQKDGLCQRAADEIERLREENARLRDIVCKYLEGSMREKDIRAAAAAIREGWKDD